MTTHTQTITLDSGRVLEVENDYCPGYPGDWLDPGEPEGFELVDVLEDGERIDTTESEDAEIIAQLWHDMLRRRDEEREPNDD